MRRLAVWALALVLLVWGPHLTLQQDGSGSGTGSGNRTTLRIMLIAPFPDDEFEIPYSGGHSLIPGGLLAVEQINSDPNVLSNYYLEPVIADGGCTLTVKALTSILAYIVHKDKQNDYPVVGIVGPVCSEASTAASAQLGEDRIHVPLVTLANIPTLNNRTLYPYTFGAVSSSGEYTLTGIKVFMEKEKRNEWDQLAVLYEGDRPYNLNTYIKFKEQARDMLSEQYDNFFDAPILSYYMPLDEVIQKGIRVIYVYASKDPACQLMCLAYHLGMRYPSYQFFFTDRRLSNFRACSEGDMSSLPFTYNGEKYECTVKQMEEVMEGSVLLRFNLNALKLESPNTETVSGYTFDEFEDLYMERLMNYTSTNNISASVWAYPFYDAVWAIALAANKVLPNLSLDSQLDVWENEQLLSALYSLNFQGVSTRIQFNNDTGFAHSVIDLFQVRLENGTMDEVLFGHYNSGLLFDADNFNSSEGVLKSIIESSFGKSTETIPLWLSISGYVLAAIVLVATIIYHVLHIAFRNRHSIKAGSPKLNHFIFLGCYLLVGSVILSTTTFGYSPPRDAFERLCYAETWLQNIGVALVFSTLFVKYYRLYLVFIRTYDHRINLSNTILSIVVIVLVMVDVVILIIWTPFKPLEIDFSESLDHSVEPPVNRERRVCVTSDLGIWFNGVTYGYICLLCLAVVTLSVLNRRIKRRDFNTTATTNILVYLYALLLGILVPTAYIEINYGNTELKYGLINSVFLIFVILCLALLFTPPLLTLAKEEDILSTHRVYTLTNSLRKASNVLLIAGGRFEQEV